MFQKVKKKLKYSLVVKCRRFHQVLQRQILCIKSPNISLVTIKASIAHLLSVGSLNHRPGFESDREPNFLRLFFLIDSGDRLSRRTKLAGDCLSRGIKLAGDRIGWRPFVHGDQIIGDQIGWGLNWLGTICPGGPSYWGPNWGDQMSGDQMRWGPNASQPYMCMILDEILCCLLQ